jgi:hypothetical protein
MRRLAVLVAAALAGCGGDPSVLSGSEIHAAAAWQSIGVILLTPSTGCLAQEEATSYSLDGTPLPLSGACGASSGQLTEDRTYVIEVQNHGDRAEMVVADLFPGAHASFIDPADGRVAPGGTITLAVPPVLRFAQPYIAHFVPTDGDNSEYGGNFYFPPQASPDTITLVAPNRAGHFQIEVDMESSDASLFAPGRIVSCSGVASCYAAASSELGPIPLEVVP